MVIIVLRHNALLMSSVTSESVVCQLTSTFGIYENDPKEGRNPTTAPPVTQLALSPHSKSVLGWNLMAKCGICMFSLSLHGKHEVQKHSASIGYLVSLNVKA